MTTILGVDPGSQVTGYGLLACPPEGPRALCYDTLRPPRGQDLADRLHFIHRGLGAVIAEHMPDTVVVETAFYHKSPRSTLVLGHVRGVVLLAAREAGVEVKEYAPRQIKMAVTGSGNAAKDRVGFMVRGLLGLAEAPPQDAADALAVALCHLHRSRLRLPS